MNINRAGKDSHNAYYDKHFMELHNDEAEELRWSKVHKALINLYPIRPKNLTILDFGCGNGWLSNKLGEFGRVTGIDFSELSIASAKKQFPDVDFRVIDITSNEIEQLGKESFDLIISSEVMEHIINHELFINQVSFLLNHTGKLLLTTPNGKWHNSYFTANTQLYKQPVENWISGNNLKMLLQPKFTSVSLKTFYANWIYTSRSSIVLKLLANDYIRAGLKKMHLFDTYLSILERCGLGLYLIVTAKKNP